MSFSFRNLFSQDQPPPAEQPERSREEESPDSASGGVNNPFSSVPSSAFGQQAPGDVAAPEENTQHRQFVPTPLPTGEGSFEALFGLPSSPAGKTPGHPLASYSVREILPFIPPSLVARGSLDLGRMVSIPLPSENHAEIKLSVIQAAIPEIFATEITPLNDSSILLPAPGAVASSPRSEGAPAGGFPAVSGSVSSSERLATAELQRRETDAGEPSRQRIPEESLALTHSAAPSWEQVEASPASFPPLSPGAAPQSAPPAWAAASPSASGANPFAASESPAAGRSQHHGIPPSVPVEPPARTPGSAYPSLPPKSPPQAAQGAGETDFSSGWGAPPSGVAPQSPAAVAFGFPPPPDDLVPGNAFGSPSLPPRPPRNLPNTPAWETQDLSGSWGDGPARSDAGSPFPLASEGSFTAPSSPSPPVAPEAPALAFPPLDSFSMPPAPSQVAKGNSFAQPEPAAAPEADPLSFLAAFGGKDLLPAEADASSPGLEPSASVTPPEDQPVPLNPAAAQSGFTTSGWPDFSVIASRGGTVAPEAPLPGGAPAPEPVLVFSLRDVLSTASSQAGIDLSTIPLSAKLELPLSLVEPQLSLGEVSLRAADLERHAGPEAAQWLRSLEPQTPVALPQNELFHQLADLAPHLMPEGEADLEDGFSTLFSSEASQDAAMGWPHPQGDTSGESPPPPLYPPAESLRFGGSEPQLRGGRDAGNWFGEGGVFGPGSPQAASSQHSPETAAGEPEKLSAPSPDLAPEKRPAARSLKIRVVPSQPLSPAANPTPDPGPGPMAESPAPLTPPEMPSPSSISTPDDWPDPFAPLPRKAGSPPSSPPPFPREDDTGGEAPGSGTAPPQDERWAAGLKSLAEAAAAAKGMAGPGIASPAGFHEELGDTETEEESADPVKLDSSLFSGFASLDELEPFPGQAAAFVSSAPEDKAGGQAQGSAEAAPPRAAEHSGAQLLSTSPSGNSFFEELEAASRQGAAAHSSPAPPVAPAHSAPEPEAELQASPVLVTPAAALEAPPVPRQEEAPRETPETVPQLPGATPSPASAPAAAAASAPAAAPAIPPSGSDLRDIELRAVFGTAEAFTCKRVADLAADLPGVDACAIVNGSLAAHAPRGRDAADLASHAGVLLKSVRDLAAATGMPNAETFTLHTDRGVISIFTHGECCLAVRHAQGQFDPGVREKLILVARGLAALDS